jgi:16S rRNA (adenine1518-N6/adenine1519-N6)-dimethyltransferase
MLLGQHFLINNKIADKIVKNLELKLTDTVLEIGPGKGILTERIINKVKKLIVVEIDKNLCNFLKSKFGTYKNLEIANIDFLKYDLSKFDTKIKIVGNIPYAITSEILDKIFSVSFDCWELCVLMVQKEVAEKLVAKPKEKMFSKLTLKTNFYTIPKLLFKVDKSCFKPQPKVTSAVVKFVPNYMFKNYPYTQHLFKLLNIVFIHKRKLLINSLVLGLKLNKEEVKNIFINSDIKLDERVEDVDIFKYLKLTEKLKDFIN